MTKQKSFPCTFNKASSLPTIDSVWVMNTSFINQDFIFTSKLKLSDI